MGSNSTFECFMQDYETADKYLGFLTYFILTPVHVLLNLTVLIPALKAFKKRAKAKGAYWYQIFLQTIGTVEAVAYALFSFTNVWCTAPFTSVSQWCMKQYLIMWYGAHMSFELLNIIQTTRLLISVSMSADRVFALFRPLVYKNIHHRKHQLIALITCVFLGVSTGIFGIFTCGLKRDETAQSYTFETEEAFYNSTAGTVLAFIFNGTRMGGLVILILCNACMIKLYQKRMKKVATLTIGNTGTQTDKGKTVGLLTIFESSFTTIDITLYVVFYSIFALFPEFAYCYDTLMSSVLDLTLQTSSTLNLYLMLYAVRSFREMVLKEMSVCKRAQDEAPTNTVTMSTRTWVV